MRMIVAGALVALVIGTANAKPPSKGGGGTTAPNPQVAYETIGGRSYKLIVANDDGTNASTLHASSTFFRFDLAPRAQRQIAFVDSPNTNASLHLLTYQKTGSGTFEASSVEVLAPARSGSFVDFSPDGTKIAYACCSNGETETLVVYDLTTGATTEWATDVFFWDLAWFRDGASIAYSVDPGNGRLYEVVGPGSEPKLLGQYRGEISLDASRTNPDALVLDYHDASGSAYTGLWQAPTDSEPNGHFLVADLANETPSFNGNFSCDDRKLIYYGPPNKTPTWYIRNLDQGTTSLFSRQNVRWVQFWPTCS